MATTSEQTIIAMTEGEGQAYLIGPEMVTIKFPGAETEGAHVVIEIETPPGGGPPLHTHVAQEIFSVLEGEFEFPTVRDGRKETTRATAGSVVHVPGGIPHTYHNVGLGRGRLLGVLSPATEMEGFFKEAGVPIDDPAHDPAHRPTSAPFDLDRFLAVCHKYHIRIVEDAAPTEQ